MLLTVKEAKALLDPCVYALCDLGGKPFYVGKTVRPWRRFAEHCWKPRGTANLAVAKLVAELGQDLRILILHMNPVDIKQAERLEIAARPWLLNAVGPHHWSWNVRHDKPWAAGTGIFCPTTLVLSKMKDKNGKAVIRSYLKGISKQARCCVEIETFQMLRPWDQVRLETRWLSRVHSKMLRCLENASS